MNDESLIGKKLKYKGDSSDKVKEVIGESNGYTHFSDNSQVETNKVNNLFEEAPAPNPDTFFENNSTLNSLANEYKNIQNNSQEATQNRAIPDANDVNYIDPNATTTQEQILETRELRDDEKHLLDNVPKSKNSAQKDEWLESQGLKYDNEDVRRVNTDEKGDYKPGMKVNNDNTSNTTQQPVEEDPALKLFKSMKKSKNIKISVEIEDMIPEIESIKHFNNMFDIPVLEYLAKGIAKKYLENPHDFEKLIQEELDSIVNKKSKRKTTTTKRKTTAKKTSTKKESSKS